MIEHTPRYPADFLRFRLVITAAAVVVYFGVPMLRADRSRPAGHFPQLAQGFLRGELSIEVRGGRTEELIPAQAPDRFYCPYPPLPAVLFMPIVLLSGMAINIKVEFLCRLISVVNVWLFDACLSRLPQKMGLAQLSHPARIMLTLLFAFGTATWSNAQMGGDWHLAHAVALAAMLLAMGEYATASRPTVIGLFVGLAMLARPTTALTGLFFALPLMNRARLRDLSRLCIGPLVALLLFGVYNAARFGSASDFGYERMILHGEGRRVMETYGQFHWVYVPRNVFWFFLAPPWIRADHAFPWLGYDPRGMSLLVATPAFLYGIIALRRDWHRPAVRHAAFASAACLVPLLLYFNTGFWQFGHRFSMDYLPLLMVLVLAGMSSRPSRIAWSLITLSIGIQAWGVLFDSVAWLPIRW